MKKGWSAKIQEVQTLLAALHLDGWLLYDFRRTNDLACRFLEIPPHQILSRRFFYWIPQSGNCVKIVNVIEDPLAHLPGEALRYRTWGEMESALGSILHSYHRIAMEYSPYGALPVVSKVDGGTLDLVRRFGIEVASSCDLLQATLSALTEAQYQSHLFAADLLDKTAEGAWQWIASQLEAGMPITEYDVQQWILQQFPEHQCIAADAPICAVNAHSADPHYTVSKETASPICPGDFILIDLWCKQNASEAVYGDITRVGVAGKSPSKRQQEIFEIVRRAQQTATDFVRQAFQDQRPVYGYEVDDVCRTVVEKAGYGPYFVHRTGHNIDTNDHGSGANIDNLETHDGRQLIPRTCFSIEPGIYLPGEFGVRLEYDVYIKNDHEIQVTGGIQDRIRCLSLR